MLLGLKAQHRDPFTPPRLRQRVQRLTRLHAAQQLRVSRPSLDPTLPLDSNPARFTFGLPSSRRCSYTMPAAASSRPSAVLLNPGLREIGVNRTSTSRVTPIPTSRATKPATVNPS
jgi:hypothetical protein